MVYEFIEENKRKIKKYKQSRVYIISVPLIFIVATGCVGANSIIHYFIDNIFQLLISRVLVKSFLHFLPVKLLETFHCTMRHHNYGIHNFFLIFS